MKNLKSKKLEKKSNLFSGFTKKVEILDEEQLLEVIGGKRNTFEDCTDCDSIDVHSELASGGTTTDTYE